jgi:hypothetical protein
VYNSHLTSPLPYKTRKNLFNPAPTGPDKCQNTNIPVIKHYLQCLFLQVIICYFKARHQRICTCHLFSIHHKLAFPIITDPVTNFRTKCTSVNHLYNPLSTCQSICIWIRGILLYTPLPPVSLQLMSHVNLSKITEDSCSTSTPHHVLYQLSLQICKVLCPNRTHSS